MKRKISQQILEKFSNTKCHQDASSESRVVVCAQADMTKLRVAFRTFANEIKLATVRNFGLCQANINCGSLNPCQQKLCT